MASRLGTRLIMFLFEGALLALILTVSGSPDQASFAVNTGNVTGNHDPLAFDAVFVNRNNALDQNTWKLAIESWGLFLVTLSAGYPGSRGHTDLRLQRGGSLMTRIYAGAATGARDNTLGLDIVSFFDRHEELHISSYSSNLVSTPNGKLTSWGTVSLSNEIGIEIGFGVCRSSTNSAGLIAFNQIWANIGNYWNTGTNTFNAPTSGLYFFSFSVGVSSSYSYNNLQLFVNGSSVLSAYRSRKSPYFIDSLGRSVMIHLRGNDQVSVRTSAPGYSDSTCITTFSGFLYSTLREEQLAWAVYRTSDHNGSADPLVYDHIEVTEGGAWANNQAHCSFTGLYYVHISAGVLPNYPAQLTVMKGAVSQGEAHRITREGYSDVINRSMIIQCNAGETLRVVVSSDSGLHSTTSGKFTAFIGFYLFA